jgi:hypothetical protein
MNLQLSNHFRSSHVPSFKRLSLMPKNRPRSRAVVTGQFAGLALPHDLAAECLQVPQIPQKHACPGVLQDLDALVFGASSGAQKQLQTAESDQDLQAVWVCHSPRPPLSPRIRRTFFCGRPPTTSLASRSIPATISTSPATPAKQPQQNPNCTSWFHSAAHFSALLTARPPSELPQ